MSVNGLPAKFTRDGEDLVITPKLPLLKGLPFLVQVSHYTAHPSVPDPNDLLGAPFFITPDGSATAGQPDGTHKFLPSNDHPRDKASYTIRFDVPAGEPAFANGVLLSKCTSRGRTHYVYLMRQPMATELIQLAVGNYQAIDRGLHDGLPVRDVVAPSLSTLLADKLPTEIGHIDWMQERVGRYPFDIYGSFVVDALLGFALETQTLSLYDRGWFDGTYGPGAGTWEPTMVHELSHMWFGDSVSPYEWSDLWLNEGHATWYQCLFAAENGQLEENIGIADFAEPSRSSIPSAISTASPRPGRAAARAATRPNCSASSRTTAARSCSTRCASRSATRRSRRSSARGSRASATSRRRRPTSSTCLAGLHQDLHAFLHAWLYDTKTPPMPGHPDWTVDPVNEAARTLTAPKELRVLPKR